MDLNITLIEDIAKNAGLNLWESLTEDEQKIKRYNGQRINYYRYSIFSFHSPDDPTKKKYIMLSFFKLTPENRLPDYIVNITSKKVSPKSRIKIPLTTNIINQISNALENKKKRDLLPILKEKNNDNYMIDDEDNE